MSIIYTFRFCEPRHRSFAYDGWCLEIRVKTKAKSKKRFFIEERLINEKHDKVTPWSPSRTYGRGLCEEQIADVVVHIAEDWEPCFVEVLM